MRTKPNTMELERLLPQSPEAERIVLDAILADGGMRGILLDSLQASHFFDRRHVTVFAAMMELRQEGKAVDLLSVNERLEASGKMEAAGGIDYLAGLCSGEAIKAAVAQAADTVRDKAARRALVYACEATRSLAFEGTEDAAELADRMVEKLLGIARDAKANEDLGLSLRDAALRLLAELEGGGALRIFSDIEKLDETTGGFRAGELVILSGSTGHGKTLLASQIARRACRDGHHAAYFSGEMLAAHLESRRLAAQAQISPSKLRKPEHLDKWEWDSLVRAASHECAECRIIDTQRADLTLSRIRHVARSLKAQSAADLIVVDYDELIDVPGKDEWERQRTLVYGLKRLAMELASAVILVSQLRKSLDAKDAKQPTIEKLYGSGAKSKHASCVVYVDRPFVRDLRGDETAGKIFVLKNRDGRVGVADVIFNVNTLRFESDREPKVSDHKAAAAGDDA